ncbi:hypothetical protein DL771_012374 [Monosporascus sp. 5C6A]|nr:hypothetical protein DL771_012374 [Monosporascus sp. 5C6A]
MLPQKSPIEISGSAWQNIRRQKTWLLKSHPEARLGNDIVHDLLSESHAPTESDDDAPWHPALFAIGELADNSGARGVSSATFLALAVGGANNILRLARLDEEEWRWKDEENVGLHLVNASHHQPALWDGGIGSIRRLKCVVDSKRDGSGSRLKLGVAPGAKSKGQTTTLVTIYSTGNSWLDIFHINFAKHDPQFISFYREAVVLRIPHDALQDTSIQAMQLHPVAITVQPSQALSETARLYAEKQIRFYQLVILDAQLRVSGELCVSSGRPVNHITAPNHRVEIRSKQLRERKQLVRNLASRFIVQDDFCMLESGSGLDRPGGGKTNRALTTPAPQRFLKPVYEQLDCVFEGQAYGQVDPEGASGGNTFENVQFAVQEATASGGMPAATLLQIIRQFDLPEDVGLVASEWEEGFERLQLIEPRLTILDLSPPPVKAPEWSGLSLPDVYAKLQHLGADVSRVSEESTWTMEIRPAVLRKMACDLCLSLRGLVYGRPDLSMTQRQPSPLPSSPLEYPDDMSITSSPAPQSRNSPGAGSQGTVGEKSQEGENEEEPAMVLLRSYTGSGKFVPRKRFELLSQWQIGADPENHVFDLDKEKEVTPGMQRRAKILARESRKRRRAETLLQKIQREPSLPTTQPAPEVRFSQRMQPVAPFSTQSQLHSDPFQTMSQPVAGAFAQRPKKRPKRKTGF